MIKTTQADVLNKIVPQKDKSRGVYTASVPSQEILSYVYNTTLLSDTETFENRAYEKIFVNKILL